MFEPGDSVVSINVPGIDCDLSCQQDSAVYEVGTIVALATSSGSGWGLERVEH